MFLSPHFVKVSSQSVKNWLRYWWKCAVLLKTWGCYPSLQLSQKINSTLWRFWANPLRIDWDIDENVQFYLKHGVVTPHCNGLKKLTLLCEGFKPDVPHCFPCGIHPVVSPVVSTPWFPFMVSMLFSLPLPDLLLKIRLEMLPFHCFLLWYPVVYFRGILLWFSFVVSVHGVLLFPFVVSFCGVLLFPFMVSTVVSSLWCPPHGVMVSTPWCHGVHPVVSWCPPCGVVVSTPWCHGVHPMVSWCPPHGVVVSTPWCCGLNPMVL